MMGLGCPAHALVPAITVVQADRDRAARQAAEAAAAEKQAQVLAAQQRAAQEKAARDAADARQKADQVQPPPKTEVYSARLMEYDGSGNRGDERRAWASASCPRVHSS